ncbi:MAG: enoyl-CoA hydratase/isomerase family protein [Desulfarculus sp.]|nr:MAG: enoyl-CoA hydratase/isomerase family protein [Desulfarculus sp.]
MNAEAESRGYTRLLFEQEGPVLRVLLNLPEARNALDLEVRPELIEVFRQLNDDDGVKVVILAGVGGHFCGGSDIRSMQEIKGPVAARKRMKLGQRLIQNMVNLEKPIIAQVDGAAAGAGVSLALAADLVIASDRARFFFSFVKVGLAPDWGQYYFLPLRVGMARAKELMFSGGPLAAEEAARIGLVNRVVPAENLAQEAWAWAASLAQGPSQAYALAKAALNCWPMSLPNFLEMEASMQAVALNSQDFQEGRDAFLEKRKPRFKGE